MRPFLRTRRGLLLALVFLFGLHPSISSSATTPAPAMLAPELLGGVDQGAWTLLAPASPKPPARYGGGMTYDSNSGRMIIYGGEGVGGTWALQLSGQVAWTDLNPTSSPGIRRGASLVFDPIRNRVILFGGDDGTNYKNDVWILNLNGPPNWSYLVPAGTPPSTRMWARGVYDPVRDRIVYFGGYRPDVPLGDIWALSLGGGETWTAIDAGAGPSPRWGGVGVYDPVSDRLLITMGTSADGLKNEVWALALSQPPSWTQVFPGGPEAPLPRYLGTGVYDAAHGSILLFGGYPSGESEVWQLTLAGGGQWTRLTPLGPAPPGRRLHYSVYDASNNRMVVFGGFGQNNDAWALTFSPVGGQPPIIGGFSPNGGPAGTSVTILGDHLANASLVEFNGVAANILSNTDDQILTQVPAGASTGKIRVTTPYGTALSSANFIVDLAPIVSSASPDSGKMRTQVTIRGHHFVAVSRVSFGGLSQALYEVQSDSVIVATVDSLAVTGHIFVTTAVTTGESGFNFRVIPLDPRPRVRAVRDVPRDQGGKVVVAWEASDFDVAWRRLITKYRVWRRASLSAPAQGAMRVRARELFPARPASAAPEEYWESIAELPAAFLPGYAYTATTPSDSTEAGDGRVAFFVQALTTDAFGFYTSNVDSGYSVDNLSPPQPTPFAADYGTYQVALRWGRSRAPDLGEFRLYRGQGPGFPIGPESFLTATRETTHVDAVPGAWNYSYKLVAVDVHGNSSRVALVSPEIPVAVLASLVSAEGDESRIRLVWFSGGNPGVAATVYRRRDVAGWVRVAEVMADGSGYIRFDDESVEPGARYAYRVGILDGDEEVLSTEVWVTAESARFALLGPWPNPTSSGRFAIAIDLPSAGPASLDLWDISGRRVERVDVGAPGRGRRTFELGARARLAPGVYLLRFAHVGRTITRRVVVLE